MNGFGPHLMVDISDCNVNKLDDFQGCYTFLDSVPDLIGMTKITQANIFRYDGVVPEDRGITGTIIIAESHISIHTFPLKNYAFIDIFSCKPFDTDKALGLCIESFEAKSFESWVQYRGKKFLR